MRVYAPTALTEADLDFIVREFNGSLERAIKYCYDIADVAGPLSNQYTNAAERLQDRKVGAKRG